MRFFSTFFLVMASLISGPVFGQIEAFNDPAEVVNCGWVYDPNGAQRFSATLSPELEKAKIKLIQSDSGEDVFLYRHVVECIRLRGDKSIESRWIRDGRLRAYNQGSVGSCTGHGTAAALNCVFAVQCLLDDTSENFIPLAADGLYGLGREKGGMLRSGDGCCGFMLAEAITELGTLYRKAYNDCGFDLTDYDENRCRSFGSKGVGDALKSYADDHLTLTVVNVKKSEEAWSLIGSGYAINVCSMQGFTTKRDTDGCCQPSGKWAHSMAIVGRRTTADGRKLFLIQNSWGDSSPTGPLWSDQPYGSFFADYKTVEKMLAQGDSFAYSGIGGFEPRKITNLGTLDFIGRSSD